MSGSGTAKVGSAMHEAIVTVHIGIQHTAAQGITQGTKEADPSHHSVIRAATMGTIHGELHQGRRGAGGMIPAAESALEAFGSGSGYSPC